MLTVSVLPGSPPATLRTARITNTWRDDAGVAYARARISADARWIEWDGVGTFRFRPPMKDVAAWTAEGADPGLVRRTFERFLQPTGEINEGHFQRRANLPEFQDIQSAFAGLVLADKRLGNVETGGQSGLRQVRTDAHFAQ